VITTGHVPPNPMITWNKAETAMAPDNSLIRICQSSVRFSWDICLRTSGAGHCHCGRFNIARVGTKNDMVPPCTNGNLMQTYVSSRLICCRSFLRTPDIKFYVMFTNNLVLLWISLRTYASKKLRYSKNLWSMQNWLFFNQSRVIIFIIIIFRIYF